MELVSALLQVHESNDPSSAFQAMAEALRSTLPLRCAFYIQAPERVIRDCWPAPVELTEDLVDTAMHVLRPEVFPLGSEFPFDAAQFPHADMLILPVRRGEEGRSACVLVADTGSFGEDLQRRVEESEALHTLGLAANRTLAMAEVLNLVARFTRTLLGAHYVIVHTAEGGLIHSVASVGLRNVEAATGDYHLARTVVEAEKPLTVGGRGANLQVDNFPFHLDEGMKAGIGIPLSLFGDTFGALVVGYRREYEVTPRDIRLAMTLSGHAAVAISNARLHATVEERSRELQSAYEELNRLTQAKERFFASINHELRNPVGAILGYQSLVLDRFRDELPEKARAYLTKAHRAAETLRTLINDILDLSKLAAGKMDVDLQPCTVAQIIDDVLNTIQPLADEKGVPLAVEIAPDLPLVSTDSKRVQQILVNLVSNAVKFTGDGGVRVGAAPVRGDTNGTGQPESSVEVRVTDTGAGISEEDQKRIFEEYEQVKGTQGGTGLGLPISRRLARALGGELWVESEVGNGSVFVLRIPTRV